MKALGITEPARSGELTRRLRELELPLPEPGKGELRLRVQASSINIDDIHIAEGTMIGGLPVGPKASEANPLIPGTDVYGVVDAVGPEVTNFRGGERVFGISRPADGRGPWAEYCIVKAADAAEVTGDDPHLAALPLSGSVALDCIKNAGEVRGKLCLVVGGSGGIGSLCIQALRTLGAEVWTVSSGAKTELLTKLGASRVIDRKRAPFDEQILAGSERVDLVFDFVGGRDVERRGMAVLKKGGRFLTAVGPVAWIGERPLGWGSIARMFAYIAWRTVASRFGGKSYRMSVFKNPDWRGIQELLIKPGNRALIDSVTPLETGAVREAIERVKAHRNTGRVLIAVEGA